MGAVTTSVRAMLNNAGAGFNVIEAEKQKKSSYVNSGLLHVSDVSIERHPTFTEFIAGGMEISLMVAIDFTASNGDPANPTSLHHIDPYGALNQYQDALTAVGNILQPYDSDQKYPVYGFGAKLRQANGQNSPVQHCFPVYGGGVEVHGVEGILQAYKDGVQNVILSGPTLFGPLINAASGRARSYNCRQDNQKYEILLILTDGVINDMEATIASIVSACEQPLSIIIVGVGAADFSAMHTLDADDTRLQSGAKIATRDIVQFVAYNEHATSVSSQLAAQVLHEVPTQVLSFMAQKGIVPNAPTSEAVNGGAAARHA